MLSNFGSVLGGLSAYLIAAGVMFYIAAKLEQAEAEYLERRRRAERAYNRL